MTLGELIRVTRERLGWSQSELARRLGVSRAAVSHWEAGMTAPTRRRIEMVLKTLGINPGEVDPIAAIGLEVVDIDQATANIKLTDLSVISLELLSNLDLIQDVLPVLASYIDQSRPNVALRIDRDEMIPEIRRGDIVVATVNLAPLANDIVLAEVSGQIIMRRYAPRGVDAQNFEAFDLTSPNPNIQTITVNSANPGKILATIVQHHRFMQR